MNLPLERRKIAAKDEGEKLSQLLAKWDAGVISNEELTELVTGLQLVESFCRHQGMRPLSYHYRAEIERMEHRLLK